MFTFHNLYFSANESHSIFFLYSWELNPYPWMYWQNIFYLELGDTPYRFLKLTIQKLTIIQSSFSLRTIG